MNKTAEELRKEFAYTRPSILKKGPIFGLGYRSPWKLGNIIQAKVAKKYNIFTMLAQQSAREIARTGRSFQEVVDSGTISAYEASLTIPWGADGDHLKTEQDIKQASAAGCTHFTYDLTDDVKKGVKAVIEKVHGMYSLTKELKGHNDFSTEISLDETEDTTKSEDITVILTELRKENIVIDEIAPRFPGYFEKAIDYYLKRENGKKIKDTGEFEKYLTGMEKLSRELRFRVSVHSGSDKFSIYPIVSRILKDNFHLKTAGTYYLEELKIIVRHDTRLFGEIFDLSFKQFQKDRATYELSADMNRIPDISKLSGQKISELLQSGSGSDDLRQVLHVTYGSILTAKGKGGKFIFVDRCAALLKQNEAEYAREMEEHIKRHINR